MVTQWKITAMLAALLILVTVAAAGCGGGQATPTPVPAPQVSPASGETDFSSSIPTPVPIGTPLKAPSEVPEEFKAVWETWALLVREHVDRSKLDPSEFAEGAIRGMLKVLNDPHTSYIDPQTYQIEVQDVAGSFQGIGAEVSMTTDGRLMIVAPLPDTPAERAGLRPGDEILEVNGEPIRGLTLLEAVLKIRGPKGEAVMLLIKHLLEDEPVLVEIVRDEIGLASVSFSMTDEGFAYIRLRVFYDSTNRDIKGAIEEARANEARGIILDLRNNPGGLLRATVDVTSQFLRDGLVLYEIDGSGSRSDWRVRRGGLATDIPMVVLVNEFSASGSEVMAGALQDHGRATLIGTKTFGKGSVGILRRLSNGGGLALTIARWYTPKGRLIEGEGLEPDIEVKPSARQNVDSQFEKAIEVLESQLKSASG